MVLDGHIHLAKVVVESSHSRPSFDIICVLFCSSSFYLVQFWFNPIISLPGQLLITNCATVTYTAKDRSFSKLSFWRLLWMATGFRRSGFFLWRGFSNSRAAGHCRQGGKMKRYLKYVNMGLGSGQYSYLPSSSKGYSVPFNFRVTLQVLAGFCRGVWVALFKC